MASSHLGNRAVRRSDAGFGRQGESLGDHSLHLERLACAALAAAYPARAAPVHNWLNARPAPPGVDPKEHAWSYMAGWYAEHGCEAFYSNLWNDPRVVAELDTRLRSSGAWQIAATLAG